MGAFDTQRYPKEEERSGGKNAIASFSMTMLTKELQMQETTLMPREMCGRETKGSSRSEG